MGHVECLGGHVCTVCMGHDIVQCVWAMCSVHVEHVQCGWDTWIVCGTCTVCGVRTCRVSMGRVPSVLDMYSVCGTCTVCGGHA